MISYDLDKDGILTLGWDMPGRSMNVLNSTSMAEFDKAVDRALADPAVKGVIVASKKPDFIAGADLELLLALKDPRAIMAMCEGLKATFKKMETGGKPFVAALNGTTLGGGYEVALACHRRIAADNPRAQIGLPEVTIGVLPGGGGTQRLPRMIGIEKALPLLVQGRRLNPKDALEQGLVDEVVPPGELLAAAKRWLIAGGAPNKPWWDKNYRQPGTAVQSPRGYETFVVGNARLHAQTRGNYPAPQAIMSCVYEGMQTTIEVGLRIESRYFTKLFMSPEARNMIRTLFFSMGDARKLSRRPKDVPPAEYKRIGILGAGMMGSGIAHAAASVGLDVVLLERTAELAEKGKSYTAKVYDRLIQQGRASAGDRNAALARIKATTDYADLKGSDLIVEAVFEDPKIKADVTAKAEAVLGADAIFASNTSTLPISMLAKASKRPKNFIGLHFFSPVDRMELLEIISGKETSPECVARALDFAKKLRKVPILVNDSRGFYTSRVVALYMEEGIALLEEGVAPALIENAGRLAGFPVGPLSLSDEVSIELMHKIRGEWAKDTGVTFPGAKTLALFVEKLGRLGRKNGKGFYEYPPEGRKFLWPGLKEHFPEAAEQPDVEEIKKRLLYVQSVDTARCLEEGVLTDPRDGDLGSILGWAFPTWTGGASSFIDMVGPERFVAECDRLAQRHGPRFAPPKSLRDMAAAGKRYYAAA
ncbi:MAG: 3-hydroxyacyl-CoA dehydrogenase NAD-binding domain-containing protein [Alphaproteobacteria bacterium]